MDMVLLDWTRMGRFYCIAGAVADGRGWKFVRPLLAAQRHAPVRNTGWSPYLLAEHTRWEIFELVRPELAEPQPPHLEDRWVLGLRSRRELAPPPTRRAILEAGLRADGEPLFGVCLSGTRTAAYLPPHTGVRSLATFLVRTEQIAFSALRRQGADHFDFGVTLDVPGLQRRRLPVKDHFLLTKAEAAGPDLNDQLSTLLRTVTGMGETVALRLGLSRTFDPAAKGDEHGPATSGYCWLMADGFFAWNDPQP